MGLHSDRDVLLLNSDTYVHSSWAERMRRAAYSDRDIATVSPLTNASHISNYPNRDSNDGIVLEVSDDVLDDLAAGRNRGRYIDVHTNVGFCMFIKRESIDSVGLFDQINFPVGYGEESDFCYRARKLGWRHVVAGDVFVRHFEGRSFGERKRQLMQEMLEKFNALHPEFGRLDERFRTLDPLRGLRANMDLARIRRLVPPGNAIKLYVIRDDSEIAGIRDAVALLYFVDLQYMQLATEDSRIFPNLERYILPQDMPKLNAAMRCIDVDTILCASETDMSMIRQRVSANRDGIEFGPTLALAKGTKCADSGARTYGVTERIDVIVPVYNGVNTIVEACIDSVIAASSHNNYHIIVIDDASTDKLIVNYLKAKELSGEIELLRNEINLGFTRTVNRGMMLNKDRDVILLNSDTAVYGPWAERMRSGAYSNDIIATANPLSNGWMSNYPDFGKYHGDGYLEITDDILNEICLTVNFGKTVRVPATIGFCMFIKRRCLEDVGLFDHHNFPTGYGEETDFCYRATALGWTHAVVGDVFVRHWENQSFTSAMKQKLLDDAAKKFQVLHPNHGRIMETFARMDPLRTLRINLDLARLKRRIGACKQLPVVFADDIQERQSAISPLVFRYRQEEPCLQLALVDGNEKFPNRELYRIPRDIVKVNAAMSYLGIETLVFSSRSEMQEVEERISGLPIEMKFNAELEMFTPS
jgi:GT2 family glycosyltransferase